MPLTVLRRGKRTPRLRSLSRAHSYKETRVDVCLYMYVCVRRWSLSTRHDTGPFYPGARMESFKCGLYATEKRSLDKKTEKYIFFKKCVPRNERTLPRGLYAIRSPRNSPCRDRTRHYVSNALGKCFGRRSRCWGQMQVWGGPIRSFNVIPSTLRGC